MGDTTKRARELRGQMSEAESLLWSELRRRQLGCRFRRQVPIRQFFVDFACLRHRLAVECDGGQHRRSFDDPRDLVIQRAGFVVMRFWNGAIFNELDDVVATIASHKEPNFDRAAWIVTKSGRPADHL